MALVTIEIPSRPLEIIIDEPTGRHGRDNIILASGSGKVEAGTVVGKVTATGKFMPYDNAASDGSEVAFGVTLYDADATSADALVSAITRESSLDIHQLKWKTGTDDAAKAAAAVDLAARFIVLRSRVEETV